MGFISKIKNILFEEEEIEVPVTPVKEEKIVTPTPVVDAEEKLEQVKQTITKQDELSERELFKSENTFNFPAFDEDEFENTLPKPKPKPKMVREYTEERKKRPEVVKHEYRIFEKERDIRNNEKKKFKPSPIISPVYGILDKDYHPDDIMPKVKEDSIKRQSRLDVDVVRKKAFGSLEDAIKETIEQPEEIELKKSYELEIPEIKEKSLDELLEESAEETIIVDEDLELENNIKEIEDELDKIDEDDDLILDDKIKEPSDDDTLEQDLFELIDSMYDDKKEVED
ncbi:MAG: hypothetical protein IJA94_03655 [Bacilli bacterium]|nr:hypothetical protein [Bacilli bacterium]